MTRRDVILKAGIAALAGRSAYGQTTGANWPTAVRRGHLLVEDGRGVVLLGGYSYPPGPLPVEEETWRFDRNGWRRIATPGPPARVLSAGAYDSKQNCVWMFGGLNPQSMTNYGDLWRWDGARWTHINVQSPGARDHHAAVFDAERGRFVVYGGGTAGGKVMLDEMLEWDGSAWNRIQKSEPGQRAHHAMAYDAVRKVTVLFGGFGSDNRYRGDTWLWDGKSWSKAADDGPPARSRCRMAWDAKRGVVVLYGGDKGRNQQGFQLLGDTWTWDGARWTQVATEGPGPKMMHAMGWDRAGERVLLYGGQSGEQVRDDFWSWNGVAWKLIT